MTRRPRSWFLLLLLVVAPTTLARVLSYSPYTNRAAAPAFQLRSAKQFVLVEQPGTQFMSRQWMAHAEVVLYDVQGATEPRVIFPAAGEPRPSISFAAVGLAAASPGGPVPVLVQTTANFEGKNPAHRTITLLGDTTGTSWKRIAELDGLTTYLGDYEDLGGYTTRGLRTHVRAVSSPKYLFIAEVEHGIWGIEASGTAKRINLTSGPSSAAVIGGDAAGRRVLLRAGGRFFVFDATNDALTDVGGPEGQTWDEQGWITPDGRAYVLSMRASGRSLWLHQQGQSPAFIAEAASGYRRNKDNFFAAPTHDYSGAWMIQRDDGKPTILLRHTPGAAIETFWSDVTGPQVEALHPGASGERLLIQVHRPRVQPERWFIDPALAIWKIGDPAPRDYEELFLNETPLKGFVHLDVDAVAQGQPFVFDSGMGTAPSSRTSPPISGGGDVVQEWGVVRSSFKQSLVLPGVARLPGAFQSQWQSDLVIYNPTDAAQAVAVKFAPLDSAAVAATNTITLAPREIRVIKDVLGDLFGVQAGGGSLHIEPAVGVVATGRTYTSAATGSYGFSMMAIDSLTAAGARFPLSFAGAFPGTNFRTNILLTAPRGLAGGARLQAYGVSGEIGASGVTVNTLDSGVMQTNNVHALLSLARQDAGGLVVRPTHGFIIPAVVAIDNTTNDPTYFPPDLPAPLVRTIPAIGHLDGANNSKFRSDLYVLNLSTTTQTVMLEAKQWDTNDLPKQISFTLLPNEDRVITDALPRLFGMTGFARLRYMSLGDDGEGVRVTSRTYNLLENGGTLGCLIPPFNSFQSATAGESLEILGVVGGEDFRVNVGLVELSPRYDGRLNNVRIEVIDDKGVKIDSFQVALPTAGGMQINNLFASRGITAPKAALIRVKPLGGGLVGAYATLTDNGTNDSSFLAANLGATE